MGWIIKKSTILLIFGTLSIGGCGGHPMRPKINLKDKGQMSIANEHTDTFYVAHFKLKDNENAAYIITFLNR